MFKTTYTVLGFLERFTQKTVKPLTAEKLENLMSSESVTSVMEKMASETDDEKKNELKQQLPCVMYQCQCPEDGIRPTAKTAIPSGFCMHDWDHMPESPREYYWQNISGREDVLGIVLAHVTPRGHGLRLVTTMKDGEQIPQCQERIAAMFNMQQYADRKVKDLSRISFLPSQDYLLYINKETLFESEKVEEVKSEKVEEVKNEEVENVQTIQTSKVAENFMYEGLKYSTIIEALLARIATQGQPQEGERNDDLFKLVRELRHICDNNFDTVYMLVAPYFSTLQDAEIRRTISNAMATNGRTMSPVMRSVLDELKNQDIDGYNQKDEMTLPKLPKLSPIEEMIISKYPKHLRSHVFLSMLPIWGLYGTHMRFDYMDGRENSLSFMTAVVGKSGSGKAFAANLFDKMTKRFRIEDYVERQKADDYLSDYNKAGEDSEKPEDPRPRVHLYGDDITTSQMLEYLDNLKCDNGTHEHGLQFTEEVSRLQKAKRTGWGDNDDLYCKAFDNAIGGKESKSKQTRNIRIPIFLNTLFCGTPGAMHKFYSNPEGGLNNRIIYVFMPKVRMKGFPRYEAFTEDEQKQFDAVAERLWEAGKDGTKIQLPWLEKAIMSLKNKWDKEDDENPDDVWYDLGKRSLVVAFRTGVLEWMLRDCPEDSKSIREICKIVRWTAEAMRQNVYAFSGKDYEQINEQDNAYQQQTANRMTKNKKLFSLLDDDFTTQDLVTLRVKNGGNSDVRMILCRWMQDGLIISPSKGVYHKIKPIAA